LNLSRLTSALAAALLLTVIASAPGYSLTGQTWPIETTVTMQLELGATNISLIDGLGTWNNSAADALTLWNGHLDRVTFDWVLNSAATKDSLDGYNSVFFSDTIFGEGFGDDTLAATVVWYNTSDYSTAIEADVVFNVAQSFNSYRGPLLANQADFHRVALHEFGHVLGLAHVYNDPAGQALMEPFISNLDHLAADDIAGVEFLYGYRITTPLELGGYFVGQFTSFTLTANNNPTSFSAVGLPQGLVLDPLSGKVSGTPFQAGTFQVSVTAHGSPRDVSAVILIEIGAASITSPMYPDPIPIGTFFTYTITAENNPTSFTVSGLPEGIVYDSKTGVISGIPDLSDGFYATVVAHGLQYDASGLVHFTVTPGYRKTIAQLSTTDNTIRTVEDPIRNRLYALNDRNVSVVDTDSLSIIATIPVGLAGHDLCLSPDNGTLWFTDAVGIHSYNLANLSPLPDIPKGPYYFDSIRAGAKGQLYVTNPPQGPDGLFQIDATTGAMTAIRVAMPGYGMTTLIDAGVGGNYLYASFDGDGTVTINRYDIASGSPVLLRSFAPPSTAYMLALSVSPDGKHVSYKTEDEYAPKETIFAIANTLTGPTTVLDPTAAVGSFNFGDPGTAGYFNTFIDTPGAQQERIDFVNTTNGIAFQKWTVVEGGPAFADHTGRNLFVVTERSIDVYALAATGSSGVDPAPRSLLNVSTRAVVGVDDQRMIGGFIITGDADKEIAFRAIGPSLPLIGTMTDPTISIYDSTGALIATNHNWNQFRDAMIEAGLDPYDEHDAGLVATLSPGAYTAVVEQEDGSTGGVGLVELYDLSSDNSGRIANISTRSKVGTGNNVMIGGFIVGGDEATSILVRAIGPSLSGVLTGVLLDPMLELYNGNGVQIASNDDWRSNQEAEIKATGIVPDDNRESAILTSVQPGPYTAIVRGKNDTTGIALVEIYNLDAASTPAKSVGQ
jgi:hypothetical protein